MRFLFEQCFKFSVRSINIFDHLREGAECSAQRYYVTAVDPMPEGYTLEDFNAEYQTREEAQ